MSDHKLRKKNYLKIPSSLSESDEHCSDCFDFISTNNVPCLEKNRYI